MLRKSLWWYTFSFAKLKPYVYYNSRSFIDFQIWDFPGQVNYFDDSAYDAREIFDTVGSLVFVIDAQDDYSNALHRLQYTIVKAYQVNPGITFEILIHKVDGLSDDYKDGKIWIVYVIRTYIELHIDSANIMFRCKIRYH